MVQIADLIKSGTSLTRQSVPIVLATAIVIIVERFLPKMSSVASWDKSAWEIFTSILDGLRTEVILAGLTVATLRACIACWFTDKAMRLRQQSSCNVTSFKSYFFRFLSAEIFLYSAFFTIGSLVVYTSTLFLPNGAYDKVISIIIAILLWPVFLASINLNLYLSWHARSFGHAMILMVNAISKYGIIIYAFFAVTGVVSLGAGILIPIIILKSEFPVFIKYTSVVIIMAISLTWLRSIGFEFKKLILWDENTSRLRV